MLNKKLLLGIICFFAMQLSMFSTTIKVVNSGYSFSPSDITINTGDTVWFSLASAHNAVEVSKQTYDAKGNLSNGGFSVGFGGGKVLFDKVGDYYYVCEPHAGMGMRGIIRVTGTTTKVNGHNLLEKSRGLKLYPNPVRDVLTIQLNSALSNASTIYVLNSCGQEVLVQHTKNLSSENQLSEFKLPINLKQGNYILIVSSATKQYAEKFVVK